MISKFIFFILALVTLFCESCSREIYFEELNNNYYLSATDTKEDMALGYHDGDNDIGVINATVFSVSRNNEYMIVYCL